MCAIGNDGKKLNIPFPSRISIPCPPPSPSVRRRPRLLHARRRLGDWAPRRPAASPAAPYPQLRTHCALPVPRPPLGGRLRTTAARDRSPGLAGEREGGARPRSRRPARLPHGLEPGGRHDTTAFTRAVRLLRTLRFMLQSGRREHHRSDRQRHGGSLPPSFSHLVSQPLLLSFTTSNTTS